MGERGFDVVIMISYLCLAAFSFVIGSLLMSMYSRLSDELMIGTSQYHVPQRPTSWPTLASGRSMYARSIGLLVGRLVIVSIVKATSRVLRVSVGVLEYPTTLLSILATRLTYRSSKNRNDSLIWQPELSTVHGLVDWFDGMDDQWMY